MQNVRGISRKMLFRAISGPLPGSSQDPPRNFPGHSQDSPRILPGIFQDPPRDLPGPSTLFQIKTYEKKHAKRARHYSKNAFQSNFRTPPRILPRPSQDFPRTLPGHSQECPRTLPGTSQNPSRDIPGPSLLFQIKTHEKKHAKRARH